MESLFTTFLSPGLAHHPSCWPSQPDTTILENCLVDLTNWSSDKNENEKETDEILGEEKLLGEKVSKGGNNGDKGKGGQDCFDKVNLLQRLLHIGTPFVMEFKTYSNRLFANPPPSCKSEISNNLFSEYFRHQMNHKAVQRRMETSLQQPTFDCCLQFGKSSCCSIGTGKDIRCNISEMAQNGTTQSTLCLEACFCDNTKKTGRQTCPFGYTEMAISAPCPCDKREGGDRACDVHDLFIQDMEVNEKGCAWTLYFSAFHTKDEDDSDQYFVNPCYEDLCEDLLDDSFEIEFTTTTADDMDLSYDTIDFADVRFSCNVDGGDESFDVYDDDEECDGFVEGDCCEIVNSELIFSSTWNTDIVMSQTNPRQSKLGNKKTRLGNFRQTSKYHSKCTSRSSGSADRIERTGCANQENSKLKKKVHFPEADELVTVHRLVAWPHAYRESRKSIWLKYSQDRAHFRRRIMKINDILEPVLKQKLSEFDRNI